MAPSSENFTGSIAEIYDRLMVPLIFEQYALDLAERLRRVGPRRVLETAAGTGALTRTLLSRLPETTTIVSTDLNEPMLAHAARRSPSNRVTWRRADALALPFEDGEFDAVTCQFGVMFFPDKVHGYREARRVLKPGGHFVFNVWDSISNNEFAGAAMDALATLFPRDPPRFMARTPHGYHDVEKIREELTAAGFTNIEVDTVEGVSKASSASDAAIAYCQGTPVRSEIEARDPMGLEAATRHASEALAARFGQGPIEGRIRAFVFTASRDAKADVSL